MVQPLKEEVFMGTLMFQREVRILMVVPMGGMKAFFSETLRPMSQGKVAFDFLNFRI